MNLISWIKNQYYNYKFQEAKKSLSEGNNEKAVKILKEILEHHPEAPSTLLSIYQTDLLKGKNKIANITTLYKRHQSLKRDCINFANKLKRNNNELRLYINYCQALYNNGIHELATPFVSAATKLTLDDNHVNNLQSFTTDSSLLHLLSVSILAEAQKVYAQSKNLDKSERLCLLILPYLASKDCRELYTNIRFDKITLTPLSETSIKQLDALIRDIKTVYQLSEDFFQTLTDKCLKLAKDSLAQKNYIASLLISQRITERYVDARKIYVDSALELYTSHNQKAHLLIEPETLYKCLGTENSQLIHSLEPFIPYAEHRLKYISTVTSELARLATSGECTKEEILFNKAWSLVPENTLIKIVLSSGSDSNRIHFASLITNDDKKFLFDESNLKSFINELSKFKNSEFIITTLEALLNKGKKVICDYEIQILKSAKAAKSKSRKRIEIIERGLAKIQTNNLYEAEAKYLSDYIESGDYDISFATNASSSLIGHSDLAEILIAKILINEAEKSDNPANREKYLVMALSIHKSHNQLFNNKAYEPLLTKINLQIIHLATELYETKPTQAIKLLYLLRDNNLSWFDAYARLYLESIQNKTESEDIAAKIFDIIKEGTNITSSLNEQLWSKYISTKCTIIAPENDNDAISKLKKLRSEVDSQCHSSNKEELKELISNILSRRILSRAKKFEREKEYNKAIDDYNSSSNILKKHPNTIARIFICKLKDGQSFSEVEKEEIDILLSVNNQKKYQQDLAYRWCIHLISEGQLEKAEEINERILRTDKEISKICQEERIKKQEHILDELNKQICKLNKSELTPEEAIVLGQTLSQKLNDTKLIVKISTQKSNILKETIRSYAIEEYYKQGNYIQCINGLKIHDSTYLSNPTALRNIAIMSINAAEEGLLTESNYRELLAIWVTAIYQQRIFVDSLNHTSWDNLYTFTLESALGHLNYDKELPDNVNYKTPSNNVISILEIQKNLLARMETAIQDNFEYHQFFSSQIDAINKLSEQDIDECCEIVAPYMLEISSTYKKNISNALETEAEKHYSNWEAILEIGHLYGLNNGDFKKYATALKILNNAISFIENKKNINNILSEENISLVNKFERIRSNLISAVTTALNNDISQNTEYHKLYSEYGTAVRAIRDDTLTFTFSNYINQQVVKALNDKSQTLAQGATILMETYSFCKCNPHLKRNIENIIEALIHNYISDGDENNLVALSNILTTREFDSIVIKSLKGDEDTPEEMIILFLYSNENRFNILKKKIEKKSLEIQKQFNNISIKIKEIKIKVEISQTIDQVNNNKLTKCDALQKIYNLYKDNKNNDFICKNLAQLIPICVMEYIISDTYGKAKVETVLDSLKSNMSPTFRLHNSEIGKAYTLIWNQLPHNARSAIQNNPASLNDKGKALKKGLEYLNNLK